MYKPETLAVRLTPAAEKMVKKGHPWVFEKSIIRQNKVGSAGDLVVIFDQSNNTYLALGLYDPTSPIRIKVLSVHSKIQFNEKWFIDQFAAALTIRLPLLSGETNSFRWIFGENDGMPGLITDVYDHVAVLKVYSAIWLPYLDIITEAIHTAYKVDCIVYRAGRKVQLEDASPEEGKILYGTLDNPVVQFTEHGVSFSANVIYGHKTGYFLDHRHNRKRVGQLAEGKRVLDVFAYAGGFSVHALVGGATEVVSLDISAPALALAEYNASLNAFDGLHRTICGDAFQEMSRLISEEKKFDIVVVDPPSFAKRKKEVTGALHSYRRLASLAEKLVPEDGLLVMASCSSRIPAEVFYNLVEDVLRKNGRPFKVVEKTSHDSDHPVGFSEGAYLKCGYYRLL